MIYASTFKALLLLVNAVGESVWGNSKGSHTGNLQSETLVWI